MPEALLKGHGTMYVSDEIYPHLGHPETTEQWKEALLLPDDYEVVGIYRRSGYDVQWGSPWDKFEVQITSSDIPMHDTPTTVHVLYIKVYGKGITPDRVFIHHIEFSGEWGAASSKNHVFAQ